MSLAVLYSLAHFWTFANAFLKALVFSPKTFGFGYVLASIFPIIGLSAAFVTFLD